MYQNDRDSSSSEDEDEINKPGSDSDYPAPGYPTAGGTAEGWVPVGVESTDTVSTLRTEQVLFRMKRKCEEFNSEAMGTDYPPPAYSAAAGGDQAAEFYPPPSGAAYPPSGAVGADYPPPSGAMGTNYPPPSGNTTVYYNPPPTSYGVHPVGDNSDRVGGAIFGNSDLYTHLSINNNNNNNISFCIPPRQNRASKLNFD
eukprot:sb/3470742/